MHDCYFARPRTQRPVPAIVLASAIHGVDADLRAIADRFASRGFIAAAPDLFWRTLPGALSRDDPRAAARGEPRLEMIAKGELDLMDVRRELGREPLFNGRAAVMGFCYGGPYAILGPKRLGYDAGIACHGSRMLDFISHLEGVGQPVCLLWGDQDRMAPAPVLDAFRNLASPANNLEVAVFPGVQHGYMMRGSATAFDPAAFESSMDRAFAILERLATTPASPATR